MKKTTAAKAAITVYEAATLSGLSPRTIRHYVEQGVLRGYKKGIGQTSAIMVYVDSFEAFLRNREIQPELDDAKK